MKSRNPIARNSWKFNTPKVVPNKKRKIDERDWQGSRNRRLREQDEL